MIKKLALLLIAATAITSLAQAQAPDAPKAEFHGAKAELDHYRVVYQVNNGDDKAIRGALKNIENALGDPRLQGKLEVELVVHGPGVALSLKNSPYEAQLQSLAQKGVILAQCENTLRERNIPKDDIWPFFSFVPSANGEIIIRQQQGWAIVHP